ncbi:MAG: PIG-L family deacetylase [Armatimonadetes bacterium]|nr:PIG-L family deacetylase [Armatimonadota bacterium]MDE2207772.1 PIG-L family deacetylase [Armatimonadota bacterium]
MPHPDDVEILCAGTLIRLVGLGHQIHIATMTPGDKGSNELSREEIAAVRRGEAADAAKSIGAASCECLEFADLEICFDNPARKKVAGLLRRIQPHMVITTPPQDYMLDHEITSSLVRDACFNATVRNYETEAGEAVLEALPALYYTDAIEGRNLFGDPARITTLVDITAELDGKAAALSCHASQSEWLRRQHGLDAYVEAMRTWAGVRGRQMGAGAAEAFCQHRGHPHRQDDQLLELMMPRAVAVENGEVKL